jgi:TolA-binding protein
VKYLNLVLAVVMALAISARAGGPVADWAPVEKKLGSPEAAKALDAYLKKHPGGQLAARAGVERARLEENLEKALTYYREAAKADNDGLWGARAVLELAKSEYTLGHYEKALLHLDTLVLDDDTRELEAQLWFWRAQARYVLMGVKRARRDFETMLKKYPEHVLAPAAALGAGECAMASGDYDAAYKKFLSLAAPKSAVGAQALWQAAQVQEKKGNPLKALEHYRQLGSRFPNSFEATQARKKLEGKPLPKAKPTPRPKKVSAAYYAVQLGAFSKPAGAENLRKKLKKKKLTVIVKKIDVRGSVYHVVRVGKFPNEAAAETFARGLKRREGWSYRVVAER